MCDLLYMHRAFEDVHDLLHISLCPNQSAGALLSISESSLILSLGRISVGMHFSRV